MDQEYLQPLFVPYTPKPFILCLFKSLSESDMLLLRDYGKVIQFSQAYLNRPIQSYPFDYLVIDFRKEEERFYFKRHIVPFYEDFYFLLFRHSFESNHGMFFHNEITDFPNVQISKDDFDTMLLEKPLPSPNCLLSLCRYLCK